MAQFLIHWGVKPEEYYRLTLAERNAIVQAANGNARKNK